MTGLLPYIMSLVSCKKKKVLEGMVRFFRDGSLFLCWLALHMLGLLNSGVHHPQSTLPLMQTIREAQKGFTTFSECPGGILVDAVENTWSKSNQ